MQQINLYQPERYAAPRLAAANALLAVIVVSVALVALYYGFGSWQLNNARGDLAHAKTLVGELGKRSDSLTQLVKQRKPSVALESKAKRLEQDLAAKRMVLNLLTGDSAGNRVGFSGHLEGLARRPLKGLWLTGISIENGGRHLALRGNALSPDLLPRYLELLSEEKAFAGQEFQTLQMERPTPDAPAVEFQLRTVPAGSKSNE